MKLDRAVTVENAARTGRAMLEALERESEPGVDVSDVQEIDLAGVQLLVAYARECRDRSIPVRVAGKAAPAALAQLAAAGFIGTNDASSGSLDCAFRA